MGWSYIGKRTTKRRRPLATPLTADGMVLQGRCCGGSSQAKTLWILLDDWGSLTAVYKAKRASSVRSFFLREPLAARAGFASGGDGRESTALARSSRNLSKSEGWKWICLIHGDHSVTSFFLCNDILKILYQLLDRKSDNTFTGHPFLGSISFLVNKKIR